MLGATMDSTEFEFAKFPEGIYELISIKGIQTSVVEK